jgi:hypothetical protein
MSTSWKLPVQIWFLNYIRSKLLNRNFYFAFLAIGTDGKIKVW